MEFLFAIEKLYPLLPNTKLWIAACHAFSFVGAAFSPVISLIGVSNGELQ